MDPRSHLPPILTDTRSSAMRPPQQQQIQQPLPLPHALASRSGSARPHHHHHVHHHLQLDMPTVSDVDAAAAAFLPANDHNEYYYPRPYAEYATFQDDDGGDPGRGNWGRKLQAGGRYMRKRKLGTVGMYSADVQAEERARKRIKVLLPPTPPSPLPLTLPGVPDLSPPASPHLLPLDDPNPSLTSFLLAPGTRQSFNPFLLHDLGKMTMGLVESEGEGVRSLGRIFSLLEEKGGEDMGLVTAGEEEELDGGGVDGGENGNGNRDGLAENGIKEEPPTPSVPHFPTSNGRGASTNGHRSPSSSPGTPAAPSLPPTLHTLFITPGPLTFTDSPSHPPHPSSPSAHQPHPHHQPAQHFPTPSSQLASVQVCLANIRGVYDDLREYLRQLERVNAGLAEADMGRRRVWRAVRGEVARELGVEEGEREEEEEDV